MLYLLGGGGGVSVNPWGVVNIGKIVNLCRLILSFPQKDLHITEHPVMLIFYWTGPFVSGLKQY